jgi:hypothetical protein
MAINNIELQRMAPLLLDLQTYFLQVRTLTEPDDVDNQALKEVRLLSRHALAMLDYALFVIDGLQTELALTTVSAAAAALGVAESLRQLAGSYNVDLDLDITNKLEPVFANEAAMKGALYGLASGLITGRSANGKRARLVIAAQETAPATQRLGVYSPDIIINPAVVRRARTLAGQARSVAPAEIHNAGLGIVISDQLTLALGSHLRRFAHRGQKGLGFYVPRSAQLSIL